MSKVLKITDAVDENLKLVRDDDGTDTSIQLSKNKMKVVGDLDVTGTIKSSTVYDGEILGYTCLLNDAADTSYAVTNAFVTVDATTKVTFTAPPSGSVEIFINIFDDAASGRPLSLGLSDNATYNSIDVTHEHVVANVDETDEKEINHRWVITGLTSGTSYTYWIGAKCTHNSIHVLKWGGDATGEYAPFIMKATALPIGIYTG